uniref:Beta-defensin n=1 Tax=Equus caballus TaxID=9796 RepID=A0A3Q2GZL1_HORSE
GQRLRILSPLLSSHPLCHSLSFVLDAGRICGYGTARCQRKCKNEEFKTGICSNISPCCLKKWNANSLNPVRY